MASFQVCTDESGEVTWELRATNNQLVATGGKNRKTKVHPTLGVRFAKMIAKDAKRIDC